MSYIPKNIGTARDPAKNAFAITPNDTNEIQVGRALYIGSGGNINVVMANDLTNTPVLFKNVPDGTLLPLEVRIVLDTLTTAQSIVSVQ